ncbi:MAG TPA: bifunctional DNA primase/polymerase [Anaerolineales bacterium]|nr:bifunctional DNA primase/polymerase [Anaerolineales bacterium]
MNDPVIHPEIQAANVTPIWEQTNSEKQARTDIQLSAIDLYERGLNVFPLPTARDWILRADKNKPTKHPYPVRMQKVYASRLYLDNTFIELFDHANIGVMCGRTSGNLIAIDCDSPKAFEYIGKELTIRSIPFWAIISHRGGAYLLRLQEGEAQNVTKHKSRINDVEIWGNHHYVVMPPSVHPAGDVYQWKSLEPRFCMPRYQTLSVVSVTALEWLGVSLKNSRLQGLTPALEYPMPPWAADLSRSNVDTWIYGAEEGTRNTCLTSLAYDLAGNGVAKHTGMSVILEAAERCTPPYPEREAKAIVRSAYKQDRIPARSYFGENTSQTKTWQAAAEFSGSFDWNGRPWQYNKKVRGKVVTYKLKAYTVKRVFLALIERARLDGGVPFRATTRETSILADLNKETISHAFQALARAEIIRRVRSEDGNLFSFGDYSKIRTLTINCRNSVRNLEYSKLPKTNAERDVFGIGYSYTVWKHLLICPERNAYQTAKALNLVPSTVYSAFEKLQAMKLVTYSQAEGVFYGETRTDAALEMLALEYGRSGRSKARQQKYQLERQRFLNREFEKAKKRYAQQT